MGGNSEARANAGARLASLRRFLEIEPGNARLRRDVVDTAIAAGEFDYLRELAEKRLATAPADPEAQFNRATALIGLKDYAGALETLSQLDASISGVRFNIGFCLFALERFAESVPHLRAGYDAGERSVGLLHCLLRSLHHTGEIGVATAIADENGALIQSDHGLAGVCALLYGDANDVEKSARYARIALAGNPDDLNALVALASINMLQLDIDRARAAYSRVVTLQPQNGRAWMGLGMTSMTTRDFTQAIAEMKRGLQTLPGHIGSWHALGWAQIFDGKLEEAESTFKHALEMNRNFCESHGNLAVVAAIRGNRQEAERFIETAERLDRACMSSKYARTLLESSPAEGRAKLADLIATVPGHGPRLAAILRSASDSKKP